MRQELSHSNIHYAGDNRSPCLIPLLLLKKEDVFPLRRQANKGVEMQARIHFIKLNRNKENKKTGSIQTIASQARSLVIRFFQDPHINNNKIGGFGFLSFSLCCYRWASKLLSHNHIIINLYTC
ncbi:unnamed protein product (mitochondrion) [Musa textilis]